MQKPEIKMEGLAAGWIKKLPIKKKTAIHAKMNEREEKEREARTEEPLQR